MSKLHTFTIVLILSFIGNCLFAQQVFPVNATAALLPPHSLVLSDYANERSQDMLFTVTLNDPVEPTRDVYFKLTVKHNGQDIMVTDPNFVPMPMQLSQFTPELITGSELAPYLQSHALIRTNGGDGSTSLPEGFNKICLEVIDLQRGIPISNQACASGFFQELETPIPELPACGLEIPYSETQNFMFRWLPRHFGLPNAPAMVEYEFTLVELLPGTLDPNDGFDQAFQMYQTTTLSPTLLYTVSEPQLEEGKWYAWRVQVKDPMGSNVFENNGFGPVCTFFYGGIEDDQGSNPSMACEALITSFGAISGGNSEASLAEGDVVDLGFFELTIGQINGLGNGYSGQGTVNVPFLKAQVKVEFENLKVNSKGRVYETGKVQAIRELTVLGDDLEDSNLTLAEMFNPNTANYLHSLMLNPSFENRRTSNREDSDDVPIGLPLTIDNQNEQGEFLPNLIITHLEFTERRAIATGFSGFRDLEEGNLIRFANNEITCTPYGFEKDASLEMLSDYVFLFSNNDVLEILGAYEGRGISTSLKFNCEGFKEYTIHGNYEINPDNLKLKENENTIVLSFETNSSDLLDFTASVENLPGAYLPNMPEYVFETGTGQLDFSIITNPEELSFPESYSENKGEEWIGLYFPELSTQIPGQWDFSGQNQRIELPIGNLMYDNNGLWATASGQDLVDISDGRLYTWPFGVSELQLEFAESNLFDAILKGNVKVPIIDEPFAFETNLDTESEFSNPRLILKPTDNTGGMSLWKAALGYNEDAKVWAIQRKIGGENQFFPQAELHGNFSVHISEEEFKTYLKENQIAQLSGLKNAFQLTEEPNISLNNLLITELIVDPLAPIEDRYILKHYDQENTKIKIGDKELRINSLWINNQLIDGKEEIGLEIGVIENEKEVTITLWAILNELNGFDLDRIETDVRQIDCDCVFEDSELPRQRRNRWDAFDIQNLGQYASTMEGNQPEKGVEFSNFTFEEKFPYNPSTNEITIPYLNLKLKTNSDGSSVLGRGLSDWDCAAIQVEQGEQDTIEVPDLSNFEINTSFFDKLENHTSAVNAEIEKGNPSKAFELPIDLTEHLEKFLKLYKKGDEEHKFPDSDHHLILVGFDLNPDKTKAIAKLLLTVREGSQYFVFGNAKMELFPNAVQFDGLKMYLLEGKDSDDDRFPFTYLKSLNGDESTGSYAELSCNGFEGFNVQGTYAFHYEETTIGGDCTDIDGSTGLMEVNTAVQFGVDKIGWLNRDKIMAIAEDVEFQAMSNSDKAQVLKNALPSLKDLNLSDDDLIKRLSEPEGCRPNLYQQLSLDFIIKNKDLGSFIAPLNLPEDQMPMAHYNFESVLFHPIKGVVDFSDTEDPWTTAPEIRGNKNTFIGIHFEELDLQPIGFFSGNSNTTNNSSSTREVLKIPAKDFVFEHGMGFSGHINKYNPVPDGDLGGWNYTMDLFRFTLIEGAVKTDFNKDVLYETNAVTVGGMLLKGKIQLPIVEDKQWMEFDAAYTYSQGDKTPLVFMIISESELGQVFDLKFLGNIKMQMCTDVDAPAASITLALNESGSDYFNASEFEPYASISGSFWVEFDGQGSNAEGSSGGFKPSFFLPRLDFQDMEINNPGRYSDCTAEQAPIRGVKNMSVGAFSFAPNAISPCTFNMDAFNTLTSGEEKDEENKDPCAGLLQGLPLSISDIAFNCIKETDNGLEKYGYSFDFTLEVDLIGFMNAGQCIKKKLEENKKPKNNNQESEGETLKRTKKYNNLITAMQEEEEARGLKRTKRYKDLNLARQETDESRIEEAKNAKKTKLGRALGKAKKAIPSELSGKSRISIITHTNTNSGKLEFDRVHVSQVTVKGEFTFISLEGGFNLFNNDQTYGNGFKGYLNASLEQGLEFKVAGQIGTTNYDDSKSMNNPDNVYRYFFIDMSFLYKPGMIPIPLSAPFLHIDGFGGGFQYNMVPNDLLPSGDSFSKYMLKPGEKNPAQPEYESYVVEDILTPGVSLSGLTYSPRPSAFGFGGNVIFSVAPGKPKLSVVAWGEIGVNVNFAENNGKMSLYSITLNGNGYVMPKAENPPHDAVGSTEVSGQFSLDAQYNHEKGFLSIVPAFSFVYPNVGIDLGNQKLPLRLSPNDIFEIEAHGEGHALWLFKKPSEGANLNLSEAGQWYVKVGTPYEGVGVDFNFLGVTLAQMNGYFQVGHNLDPIPRIAELVPEWSNGSATDPSRESAKTYAQGDGIVMGARFKIPDRTYEFLMFRGRLTAGAGFDLSLKKYPKSFSCGNGDGKIGINNWYAKGQAYAYFKALLDMRVDLWFYEGWVNIFDAYAAISLEAELPNPTWMRGIIKGRFTILKKIKGRFAFKMEIGERCAAIANNPLAGINVIEQIIPQNGDIEVPIYENPAVSFNMPVGKMITIEEIEVDDSDEENPKVNTIIRTFKSQFKEFTLKEEATGKQLDGNIAIAHDYYSASFNMENILKAKTKYTITVKVGWQEKKNGIWKNLNYDEERTATFTTGDYPQNIERKALAYQAPGYSQRFWHKGYALPQLLFKHDGYNYLFPASSDEYKEDSRIKDDKKDQIPDGIPLEYYIELAEYKKEGEQWKSTDQLIRVPLGNYPGKNDVTIEKPTIDWTPLSAFANLSFALPKVITVEETGKQVEFAKLDQQNLKKGHVYRMQIFRSPNRDFVIRQTKQGGLVELEVKNQDSLDESQRAELEEALEVSETRATVLKGGGSILEGGLYKILYEYYFAISEFDNLADKLKDTEIISLNGKTKTKFDFPNEGKELYGIPPFLGHMYDRYFGVQPKKESFDYYDQLKLMKNLRVRNPLVLVKNKYQYNSQYGIIENQGLVKGRHPFEPILYQESNGIQFSRYASDHEMNIPYRAFDHFHEYEYRKAVENGFELDRLEIVRYRTKDQWLAISKNLMRPYYETPPEWDLPAQEFNPNGWAFHLNFDGKGDNKMLWPGNDPKTIEKPEQLFENQLERSIHGVESIHQGNSIPFAFEDARQRILSIQSTLAHYQSNIAGWYIDYYTSDTWENKYGGGANETTLRHYRDKKFNHVIYQHFPTNEKVEWAFPRLNKWTRFDQEVPFEVLQQADAVVFKLPVTGGSVSPPTEEEGTAITFGNWTKMGDEKVTDVTALGGQPWVIREQMSEDRGKPTFTLEACGWSEVEDIYYSKVLSVGSDGRLWSHNHSTIWSKENSATPSVNTYKGNNCCIDIAADDQGNLWVLENDKKIRSYNANSSSWNTDPPSGLGEAIAVSKNGTPFVIGNNHHGIFKLVNGQWEELKEGGQGSGLDISIDHLGRPWVISLGGDVWYYDKKWIDFNTNSKTELKGKRIEVTDQYIYVISIDNTLWRRPFPGVTPKETKSEGIRVYPGSTGSMGMMKLDYPENFKTLEKVVISREDGKVLYYWDDDWDENHKYNKYASEQLDSIDYNPAYKSSGCNLMELPFGSTYVVYVELDEESYITDPFVFSGSKTSCRGEFYKKHISQIEEKYRDEPNLIHFEYDTESGKYIIESNNKNSDDYNDLSFATISSDGLRYAYLSFDYPKKLYPYVDGQPIHSSGMNYDIYSETFALGTSFELPDVQALNDYELTFVYSNKGYFKLDLNEQFWKDGKITALYDKKTTTNKEVLCGFTFPGELIPKKNQNYAYRTGKDKYSEILLSAGETLFDYSKGFTVEMFVKPIVQKSNQSLFRTSSNWLVFDLWGEDREFNLQNTFGNPIVSNRKVQNGIWYHIVINSDGKKLSLIIDGEIQGQIDISDEVNSMWDETTFRINVSSNEVLIDYFRLWPYEIPACDLVASDSENSISSPLVDWDFNDGPGSTIISDKSGNDFHGKLSSKYGYDFIYCPNKWMEIPANDHQINDVSDFKQQLSYDGNGNLKLSMDACRDWEYMIIWNRSSTPNKLENMWKKEWDGEQVFNVGVKNGQRQAIEMKAAENIEGIWTLPKLPNGNYDFLGLLGEDDYRTNSSLLKLDDQSKYYNIKSSSKAYLNEIIHFPLTQINFRPHKEITGQIKLNKVGHFNSQLMSIQEANSDVPLAFIQELDDEEFIILSGCFENPEIVKCDEWFTIPGFDASKSYSINLYYEDEIVQLNPDFSFEVVRLLLPQPFKPKKSKKLIHMGDVCPGTVFLTESSNSNPSSWSDIFISRYNSSTDEYEPYQGIGGRNNEIYHYSVDNNGTVAIDIEHFPKGYLKDPRKIDQLNLNETYQIEGIYYDTYKVELKNQYQELEETDDKRYVNKLYFPLLNFSYDDGKQELQIQQRGTWKNWEDIGLKSIKIFDQQGNMVFPESNSNNLYQGLGISLINYSSSGGSTPWGPSPPKYWTKKFPVSEFSSSKIYDVIISTSAGELFYQLNEPFQEFRHQTIVIDKNYAQEPPQTLMPCQNSPIKDFLSIRHWGESCEGSLYLYYPFNKENIEYVNISIDGHNGGEIIYHWDRGLDEAHLNTGKLNSQEDKWEITYSPEELISGETIIENLPLGNYNVIVGTYGLENNRPHQFICAVELKEESQIFKFSYRMPDRLPQLNTYGDKYITLRYDSKNNKLFFPLSSYRELNSYTLGSLRNGNLFKSDGEIIANFSNFYNSNESTHNNYRGSGSLRVHDYVSGTSERVNFKDIISLVNIEQGKDYVFYIKIKYHDPFSIQLDSDFWKHGRISRIFDSDDEDESPEECHYVTPPKGENYIVQLDGNAESFIETREINFSELDFAIEARIYLDQSAEESQWILEGDWSLSLENNQLVFNPGNLTFSTTIPTDEWTHILLIKENNNASLYINFEEIEQQSIQQLIPVNGRLKIGKNLAGSIDYFRLWKTSNICEIARPDPNDQSNLILNYELNDGPGRKVVIDAAQNQQTGDLFIENHACNWQVLEEEGTFAIGGCNLTCTGSNEQNYTIKHWGASSCANHLYLYFPESAGELKRMAIYDQQGIMRYYFDKEWEEEHFIDYSADETDPFSKAGEIELNVNMGIISKENASLITSLDPEMVNYKVYAQFDGGYFETDCELKAEFQSFNLKSISTEPAEIIYPYPLLKVAYNPQNNKVKIDKVGDLDTITSIALETFHKNDDGWQIRWVYLDEFSENGFEQILVSNDIPVGNYEQHSWNEWLDFSDWGKGLESADLYFKTNDNIRGFDLNHHLFEYDDNQIFYHLLNAPSNDHDYNYYCKYITPPIPKSVQENKALVVDDFRFELDDLPDGDFTVETKFKFIPDSRVELVGFDAWVDFESDEIQVNTYEEDYAFEKKLVEGAWYHFTFSNKQATNKQAVYINGNEIGEVTNLVFDESDSELILRDFAGIDYLSIWDKALNATEILSNIDHLDLTNKPNLFLYYDFNEGPCQPAIIDKSGNQQHQKNVYDEDKYWISDVPKIKTKEEILAKSAHNYALKLDGNGFAQSNDIRRFNNPQRSWETEPFTMEAWIWLEEYNAKAEIIRLDAVDKSWDMAIDLNENGKVRLVQPWERNTILESTNPVPLKQWTHIAFVIDDRPFTSFIYLNGENNTEIFDEFRRYEGDATISIGKSLKGQIDEVKMWNYKRSIDEITDDLEHGIQNAEGLMLYYNFDEEKDSEKVEENVLVSGATLNGSWERVTSPVPIELTFAKNWTLKTVNVEADIEDHEMEEYTLEAWINISEVEYTEDYKYDDPLIKFCHEHRTGFNDFYLYELKLNKNHWKHVALTYKNEIYTIYLNGEKIRQYTEDPCDDFKYLTFKKGTTFDEIKIWSKVRSQGEIKDGMFKKLTGNESDLLRYYDFEEGSTDTIFDKSIAQKHFPTYENFEWKKETLPKDFSEVEEITITNWATNGRGFDIPLYQKLNSFVETEELTIEFLMKKEPGDPWIKDKDDKQILLVYDYYDKFKCPNLSITHQGSIKFYDESELYESEPNLILNDEWNHIALVWSSNNDSYINKGVRLFVNGELVKKTNDYMPWSSYDREEYLTFYSGFAFDELRIWDVALDSDDLEAYMYQKFTKPKEGLIAYYQFDDLAESTNNLTEFAETFDPNLFGTFNNRDELPVFTFLEIANIDFKEESSNPPTSTTNTETATNYALDFDGNNDYVEIPDNDSLDITHAITLEAWIKPTSLSGIQGIISKEPETGYHEQPYQLRLDGDKIAIGIYDFPDDRFEISDVSIPIGEWTHVAAIFDGNKMFLYVNGEKISSKFSAWQSSRYPDEIIINKGLLSIGVTDRYNSFKGEIDEVRIWNKARSAQEIKDFKDKKLSGTEPGLVIYHDFDGDGPNGETVKDKGKNGLHGLIKNMSKVNDWVPSDRPDGVMIRKMPVQNDFCSEAENNESYQWLRLSNPDPSSIKGELEDLQLSPIIVNEEEQPHYVLRAPVNCEEKSGYWIEGGSETYFAHDSSEHSFDNVEVLVQQEKYAYRWVDFDGAIPNSPVLSNNKEGGKSCPCLVNNSSSNDKEVIGNYVEGTDKCVFAMDGQELESANFKLLIYFSLKFCVDPDIELNNQYESPLYEWKNYNELTPLEELKLYNWNNRVITRAPVDCEVHILGEFLPVLEKYGLPILYTDELLYHNNFEVLLPKEEIPLEWETTTDLDEAVVASIEQGKKICPCLVNETIIGFYKEGTDFCTFPHPNTKKLITKTEFKLLKYPKQPLLASYEPGKKIPGRIILPEKAFITGTHNGKNIYFVKDIKEFKGTIRYGYKIDLFAGNGDGYLMFKNNKVYSVRGEEVEFLLGEDYEWETPFDSNSSNWTSEVAESYIIIGNIDDVDHGACMTPNNDLGIVPVDGNNCHYIELGSDEVKTTSDFKVLIEK